MSDKFETSTGIRQGASSSVLLFLVFINDLITFLKSKCIEEQLIRMMHSLLYTDDTAILSTQHHLFIIKCNTMLQYFRENKLKLNIGKSAYLIINPKENDQRCSIQLHTGFLGYKSKVHYLGAIISDCGIVDQDIQLHLDEKRPNITVKFINFRSKNYLAPLKYKLKVLNTCASSSLLYGCETWGLFDSKPLETLYQFGIRNALSIRQTTPNEITYIESGLFNPKQPNKITAI